MSNTYPQTGQNVNLPSSSQTSLYNDIYVTNSSRSYGSFNGNGRQNDRVAGGGSGATYQVSNNSTATFRGSFNLNGARVVVDRGSSIVVNGDFTNAYGGNVVLNGNLTVNGTTNLNTSRITVNTGATFTANRTTNLNSAHILIDGGTVDLKGNLSNNRGVVFDFNKNPKSTLIIAGPNENDDMQTVTIRNYVYGGTIKINYDRDLNPNASLTTHYDTRSHTLTVLSGGRRLLVLEEFYLSGTAKPEASTQSVGRDVYLVLTCFLAGSLIQTVDGEKPVEDLAIGDEIIAYVDGVATIRPVMWTGRAHCAVRPHLSLDEADYPVRILKNAFAEGVPSQDLLVTAEHCLFLDGKFVPARMLVNGRSIFYDTTITSYDYYHIETEEHSVVRANGLFTESYLDTGNRRSFTQNGKVVLFTPSRNLSWDDAAAPLTTLREDVEPVFQHLMSRAEAIGVANHFEAPAKTEDAALHLRTETGIIIRPTRKDKNRVMFMVPSGIESVRIASNASRPCDVVGPYVDDRRLLGVLVGDITIFESEQFRPITTHLETADLVGWNDGENGRARWTSGLGELPLGERQPNCLAILAIEIKSAGPYLLDRTEPALTALTA